MSCDDCMYAAWKRTSNGRLHPDKTGRCTFAWIPPPLPKAFYFYGTGEPKPSGGYIERGAMRADDCLCYAAMSPAHRGDQAR